MAGKVALTLPGQECDTAPSPRRQALQICTEENSMSIETVELSEVKTMSISVAAVKQTEIGRLAAFQLNGRTVRFEGPGDTALLWVLPDHLAMTGTKFGCSIHKGIYGS